jgi:3-dehydroquinate synthase
MTAPKPRTRTAPRSADPTSVKVALGARGYDIVIGRGIMASLGARVAALRPGAKVAIVTDPDVGERYLAEVEASFARSGISYRSEMVPRGESSKSFATFERVCEFLIKSGIERRDIVVALGGGVIGDLVGFASACVRRGVDYVQVPTTLVAQVDSSIGGKTAINSASGKNLVGAFHQPLLVVADIDTLKSLPRRSRVNGYAEVVKYGLLGNADFFFWLETSWEDVLDIGPACERAIATSCRMKADIVARDERETGERALLNLGHTFGHAIEAATGFSDRLFHGEAVGTGMALAFSFSARLGLISDEEAARVIRHLARTGLPTSLLDIVGERPSVDQLMAFIGQDKKVQHGRLTFILVRGIGKAFIAADIDPREVRAFLTEKLAER